MERAAGKIGARHIARARAAGRRPTVAQGRYRHRPLERGVDEAGRHGVFGDSRQRAGAGGLDRTQPAQGNLLDMLATAHPRLLATTERFLWLQSVYQSSTASTPKTWATNAVTIGQHHSRGAAGDLYAGLHGRSAGRGADGAGSHQQPRGGVVGDGQQRLRRPCLDRTEPSGGQHGVPRSTRISSIPRK